MRLLYLDDSGKPDPKHQSKCLVFGGFSVDEAKWHAVVRQLAGAKSHFFPNRNSALGGPHSWEVKSLDFITPNAWNRSKNRKFCHEIIEILRRNECSIYAVWLNKANATQPLTADWIVPKCFQVLAAKFDCELREYGTKGTIVCDWSTYSLDRHVTSCVQSFVGAQNILRLIGGVSYGSSMSLLPLQACDLIAGTFRRVNEGTSPHLNQMHDEMRKLVWTRPGQFDVEQFGWGSFFRRDIKRLSHFSCAGVGPSRIIRVSNRRMNPPEDPWPLKH